MPDQEILFDPDHRWIADGGGFLPRTEDGMAFALRTVRDPSGGEETDEAAWVLYTITRRRLRWTVVFVEDLVEEQQRAMRRPGVEIPVSRTFTGTAWLSRRLAWRRAQQAIIAAGVRWAPLVSTSEEA